MYFICNKKYRFPKYAKIHQKHKILQMLLVYLYTKIHKIYFVLCDIFLKLVGSQVVLHNSLRYFKKQYSFYLHLKHKYKCSILYFHSTIYEMTGRPDCSYSFQYSETSLYSNRIFQIHSSYSFRPSRFRIPVSFFWNKTTENREIWRSGNNKIGSRNSLECVLPAVE